MAVKQSVELIRLKAPLRLPDAVFEDVDIALGTVAG